MDRTEIEPGDRIAFEQETVDHETVVTVGDVVRVQGDEIQVTHVPRGWEITVHRDDVVAVR